MNHRSLPHARTACLHLASLREHRAPTVGFGLTSPTAKGQRSPPIASGAGGILCHDSRAPFSLFSSWPCARFWCPRADRPTPLATATTTVRHTTRCAWISSASIAATRASATRSIPAWCARPASPARARSAAARPTWIALEAAAGETPERPRESVAVSVSPMITARKVSDAQASSACRTSPATQTRIAHRDSAASRGAARRVAARSRRSPSTSTSTRSALTRRRRSP